MMDESRPESRPGSGARGSKFRFGPFELDPTLGELRQAGQTVPIRGQPLQVLEVLIGSPGELVTREALQHALWSDGTIVEFDDSLNNCVRRLRHALGDLATKPTYIETIPRRGYRFVGEVTRIPKAVEVAGAQPTAGMPLPSTAPRISTPAEQWRPSQAARLFTAVVLIGAFLAPDRSPSPAQGSVAALAASSGRASSRFSPAGKRIERRPTAVLTLFNRTPDPTLDWVGSALPELLTSTLAELPALRVFPRQTVGPAEFSLGIPNGFALDEARLERLHVGLGSELAVSGRYELEGTAPREKLRVVLQLYDVSRKGAVATVSELGDVAGLRDLASRLAEDLHLRMGWELARPQERDFLRSPIAADPLPSDLEAARLYSEALSRLWRSDGYGALQHLKAAQSREPSFPYVYWAQTLTFASPQFGTERMAVRHLPEVWSALPAEERNLLQVLSACWDGGDTAQECQAADPTLRRLWEQHHGDVEFGLRLADQAPPGFVRTVVADIRSQGAPAWAEVRLDLLESGATEGVVTNGSGIEPVAEPAPCQRQLRIASHGVAAAEERQDRVNLSKLLFTKGDALHCLGRDDDAVIAYREANRVMLETGAVAAAVRQMQWFADRLTDMDRFSASRTAIAEALGLARGLGPAGRRWVNGLLDILGYIEFGAGHFDLVERVVGEQSLLDSEDGGRFRHWLPIELRQAQGRAREAERLARVELEACQDEPMCQLSFRIALSRILDLEDRPAEAAQELQKGIPGPSDDVREFVTALHLVEIGDSEHARQHISEWERSNAGIFWWGEARILRVRNLLDLRQFSEAERHLSKGNPDARKVPERELESARQTVLLARTDLGLGRTTTSLTRLREVIARASRSGWKSVELDARLEYGKAQRIAGDSTAALRTLASVEGEARSLGMLLLARHAREARQ
jgi:DNA-binding winged helix-turn-helix (wHTH) protein